MTRAIEARGHAQAIAERRDAAEAFAEARRPAEASAGWSTKVEPVRNAARKRRVGEPAVQTAAEMSRAHWARRHPAAAKAERALRKGRAVMLDRWDHKHHGTPETHEHASRTNQGALARLCEKGVIDADQLHSALEIAAVAERIGADVAVKTASLETRIDSGRHGDGTFFERLGQVRREMAYTRWRAHLGASAGPVLDMIVGDFGGGAVGFTVAARRHRMHHRRAKKLLIDALDAWPGFMGTVAKEVDDAALDAAQARMLA